MRLICPSCGACASAEAWQNDLTIRQCMQMLAEMPSYVSRHVLAYLGCFRLVPTTRALRWPKVYRLMLELKELVELPYISWDQKPARPNNAKYWAQGIETVLERASQGKLKLPLENHNYLRAIAYDYANQADRAGETARNKEILAGNHRYHQSDSPQLELTKLERTPEEIEEARRNIEMMKQMLDRIGAMPPSPDCKE